MSEPFDQMTWKDNPLVLGHLEARNPLVCRGNDPKTDALSLSRQPRCHRNGIPRDQPPPEPEIPPCPMRGFCYHLHIANVFPDPWTGVGSRCLVGKTHNVQAYLNNLRNIIPPVWNLSTTGDQQSLLWPNSALWDFVTSGHSCEVDAVPICFELSPLSQTGCCAHG